MAQIIEPVITPNENLTAAGRPRFIAVLAIMSVAGPGLAAPIAKTLTIAAMFRKSVGVIRPCSILNQRAFAQDEIFSSKEQLDA
jgi:hypothetical protein